MVYVLVCIFDVMDRDHENIFDPETGARLGSIERPKVTVKVVTVEDRFAVATTYKSKRTRAGGSFGIGFAEALMPPKWVTKHETLKTEEMTWEKLKEEDSYVKTGDPVVQVFLNIEKADSTRHSETSS